MAKSQDGGGFDVLARAEADTRIGNYKTGQKISDAMGWGLDGDAALIRHFADTYGWLPHEVRSLDPCDVAALLKGVSKALPPLRPKTQGDT